jgi:hypothetical protein
VITYETRDGCLVIVDLEYIDGEDAERLLLADAAPASREQLRRDLDQLREQETRWQASATPAQHAITWGDYWRKTWQSPGEPDLLIWGRVHTEAEITAGEERLGVPAAEIDAIRTRIRGGYDRGWRYGRCWSRLIPEGELGSTHVATVERVTAAEFAAAERAGWLSP